jgi:hypothetical protein
MRVSVRGEAERFSEPALEAGAGEVRIEGTSLLITSSPEARLGIIEAIQAAGGSVERFATEEPSLEDFYLRYISDEKVATR